MCKFHVSLCVLFTFLLIVYTYVKISEKKTLPWTYNNQFSHTTMKYLHEANEKMNQPNKEKFLTSNYRRTSLTQQEVVLWWERVACGGECQSTLDSGFSKNRYVHSNISLLFTDIFSCLFLYFVLKYTAYNCDWKLFCNTKKKIKMIFLMIRKLSSN